MGNVQEKQIHTVIKQALDAEERTNRWLIDKLKDYGIELNDTQMSNRLKGHIEFTYDEATACIKILKIPTEIAA